MVFGSRKIFFDFCHLNFDDFPENDRVVVVSYFGKSLFDSRGQKSSCFKSFNPYVPDSFGEHLPCIEGYYDVIQNVVHLQLSGVLDIHTLVNVFNSIQSQVLEKGYLTTWADLKHGYARGLLFLLSISHIMVLCHPVPVFDLSYLHLFKALDAVRSVQADVISGLLSDVKDVSKDWIENGRPCSPRMLFRFDSCPKSVQDVKKLCHALEDQIYAILRKSKVISNVSSSSLFSVPANQEFVYIDTKTSRPGNILNSMMNNIVANCFHNSQLTQQFDRLEIGYQLNHHNSDPSFAMFLAAHVELALTKGFDDNVGRHLAPAPFTVPSVWQVLEVGQKMYSLLLQSGVECSLSAVLKLYLDVDLQFSESRCAKVLPLALAAYQDSLPFHYTREYHEGRLAQAMTVLAVQGRGAMMEQYAARLATDCLKYWQNGRQMCQVPSLTGHPCMNSKHRTPDQAESGAAAGLEVMEHNSEVWLMSACNCGKQQMPRTDPYNLKDANYEFYTVLGEKCGCNKLDSIKFSVFEPSVQDFRAAKVETAGGKIESVSKMDAGTTQETSGGGSDVMEGDSRLSSHHMSEHKPLESDVTVVVTVPQTATSADTTAGLIRQPSTTEYLPGMLHAESPAGLLPQYSSWSLVCLGPSSLYSHNVGLQDQPGLISASSYLLPWDVVVRLSNPTTAAASWPHVGDHGKPHSQARARKNKTDQTDLVVKIFVGVEYECPRGHRFMMAGVDKVLKINNVGQVKDTGHKITHTDMPLYYPCPCRSSKLPVAQLMRIHVVTPKAPVRVTLNPRVQPAPGAHIFIVSQDQPLVLSQSAYWVLRLPLVYMGERGPFLPPPDLTPPLHGRLLAGCYGITEIST